MFQIVETGIYVAQTMTYFSAVQTDREDPASPTRPETYSHEYEEVRCDCGECEPDLRHNDHRPESMYNYYVVTLNSSEN
jgi:hypothetical protein